MDGDRSIVVSNIRCQYDVTRKDDLDDERWLCYNEFSFNIWLSEYVYLCLIFTDILDQACGEIYDHLLSHRITAVSGLFGVTCNIMFDHNNYIHKLSHFVIWNQLRDMHHLL